MDYKLTFDDGSEAYLKHHGVKGMHWGEWNEETRERYGIRDDDGGLSKIKAFRETSYTIPAGRHVARFTSPHEAKTGTDLSRTFYASANEHDYNVYADEARRGSLTSSADKERRNYIDEVGLVQMSTVDDLVVARGKFMISEMLRDPIINKAHNLEEDPGSVLTSKVLNSPEVQNHFRKLGYDAIEDTEDARPMGGISKHPLIVLNGNKLRIDSTETFPRTDDEGLRLGPDEYKYPSWY